MKIISIHVQSFGKLNDVNLQLNDGVNAIQNTNGFGKTTMASFIRAMLYGFTYRSVGGVKDNARFTPWQGKGRFGGSMTVEHDGEVYRIERFFGATAKSETLIVWSDKTGKAVDWQMQPGEYLLGLTADSYDRSAYFPQEAVELSSNDNFDSRLANLIQNGAEDYDEIVKKLAARKKSYRLKVGKGGKIYELECRERELLQRLNDIQRAERRATEIEQTLQEIEQEKQRLLSDQRQRKDRQAALQREVAQSQISPEQQRTVMQLAELETKISRVPVEFDADFKRCEEIANQIANVKNDSANDSTVKPRMKIVMLAGLAVFFGAFLAALGAVKIIPNAFIYVGILLAVVGAVGVFIELVFRRNANGATETDSKRNELISQYMAIAQKYVFVDGADFETVKRNLWQAHTEYKGDLRVRDTLKATLQTPTNDTQQAENELKAVNTQLSDIEKQLNDLSMQVGRLTEERKGLNLDSVSVNDELLVVLEQKKQAQFEYDVCDKVEQLLAQAKDNLSSSYLPKLARRCGELLCQITDGNYEVVVDREFNVKIREQGQTHEMYEFSRGIREITLLCFRIALSELLYDTQIPFIIIDDAFVNFDEDNFVRATDLLRQLSKYAQVVYFTCHNRTGGLLKK